MDPVLAQDIDTQWWHGIAFGFAISTVVSILTITVNAVHRWLYDKFIAQSDPESWPLIWLRCSFYLILTTVAGFILTAHR